jgi:hypothetical protein
MRRFLVPDLLLPRVLVSAAGLGPDDLGLDQNIIWAADHHQMFDIVAAHNDQLPLSIEIEGVHDAQPHLAGAAPLHAKPATESQSKNEENEHRADENRHGSRGNHQRPVFNQQFT